MKQYLSRKKRQLNLLTRLRENLSFHKRVRESFTFNFVQRIVLFLEKVTSCSAALSPNSTQFAKVAATCTAHSEIVLLICSRWHCPPSKQYNIQLSVTIFLPIVDARNLFFMGVLSTYLSEFVV
jgi:hypothetical protein